jgi:hypothetical protein
VRVLNQATETLPIDAVRPHPRNPRQGDIGAIHQSIAANGFYGAVIAQRSTGFILAGNHRWKAAQQAGAKEVPVTWVDVDDDHALRILLADNRTSDLGTYDDGALADILRELQEATGTLAGTGYDGDDLDELLADLGRDKPGTAEDETPPPPAQPITQPGDLWLLGAHRLLCGDALDSASVARLTDGVGIAAIVTDPPYGLGIDGQKKSTAKNPKHNRKAHAFMGWDAVRPSAACFESLLAMGVPTAVWGGNYFADMLPAARGWVYWDKGQSGMLSMSDGELAWTTADKPLRCVTVNRAALIGSVHPTQKPVEVMRFTIDYVEPGDGPIYDPFLGSGTTLVAAEQLGRACYGMDIAPAYCDVIVKRWEALTGDKATRG